MKDQKKAIISFSKVVTSLLDADTPFPPRYLHQFCELSSENLEKIKKVWPQIALKRKLNLLEDLDEIFIADTLVSFYDVGQIALMDDNPYVRARGIQLLDECEDMDLVPVFVRLAEHDDEVLVRSSAINALRTFVLRGELEEIPQKISIKIEETLLGILKGSDVPAVRQQALMSIGYSSHEEIAAFIKTAIETGNKDWICSALVAMGRSADEQWEEVLLEYLRDPEEEIQIEAIQAAGELGLDSSRGILLEFLEDDSLEDGLRSILIISLSKVGGDGVKEALMAELEKAEDEDKAEFISECLDVLDYNSDYGLFDIFGLGASDQDDLDLTEDLSQEDDEDKT